MQITEEALNDFEKLLKEDFPDKEFTKEEIFDVAHRIMSVVGLVLSTKRNNDPRDLVQ